VLTNFKADGFTYQEKLNRYKRNSDAIFKQETFNLTDLETLSSKLPDLRIVAISAPNFTIDKSNKVQNTTIDYFYHRGYESGDTARWHAENC
jgi:hypothetical protein